MLTVGFRTVACQGKAAYATKSKAMDVLHRRSQRARNRHGPKDKRRELSALTAYRCAVCHHWHIGGNHDPRSLR